MPKSKSTEKVQVVVRCRPLNMKETKSGFVSVVDVLPSINTIQIFNPMEKDVDGKAFAFDAVYGCDSTHEQLYKESVEPIINSVLKGFNGTIFAYGQTGTGKTFTMEGDRFDPSRKGLIPKTFEHIFNRIRKSKNVQYLVRASYLEIYQEEIRDLLDDTGEQLHELLGTGSGIYVKNLKSQVCKSVKEMEDVMAHGKRNRKVAATNMNQHSSRSHAIFIITIEMSKTVSRMSHVKVGKLNLVDLAGSERQTKSCATGERLKEASKINLSLSALGNVISALSNGKNFHVPYRDSKLTRLLQDSLGGNSKTLMIANIGPACYNYNESLTTLRYANRAKNIKNKPIINEDPKDALIQQYQNEIKRLKALVQLKRKPNIQPNPKPHTNDTTNNTSAENNFTTINTQHSIMFSKTPSFSDDEKIQIKRYEAEKQSSIQETAQNIDTLERRIKSMESRILQGKDFIDHTNKQQEILQQQAHELNERAKQNIQLEQQLEKEEETTEELQDSNVCLQQEIERKMKKLTKLYSKLHAVKTLTADTIDEFNNDRNNLELSQNELIKEYKLNQIILENFLPENVRENLDTLFNYDEESETWKRSSTNQSIPRPLASHQRRRPESAYSRVLATIQSNNPRFRCENIIALDMEQPEPTTGEYHSPKVSPSMKCVLLSALRSEDDITVDASSIKTNHQLNCNRKSLPSRSKYQQHNYERSNCTIYPKVRGLVKRK